MAKLYKKEEESLLNKKKKREEIKQKSKSEKTKTNKNINGIKQYNNNYMGIYMNQIQPVNNQPQGYIDGYPNLYYYNNINSSYPFPTQMFGYNTYFQSYMEQPKNLEEHINLIYQRGIVNNIIGAFFIKEYQEKLKNNEKRTVPVAMVELEDDQGNNNKMDNNDENINRNDKNDIQENEAKNHQNEKNGEDNDNINNIKNEETKDKNELRKPEFIN